jgi:hypothetical protein
VNRAHQILIYADYVNLLGKNINTGNIKKLYLEIKSEKLSLYPGVVSRMQRRIVKQ